jgi:hypothetical protein
MQNDTDHAFSGSNVSYTHLEIFNDAIISYCQWKLAPVLSKDQLTDITEMQYKRIREEAFNLFRRRKDISSGGEARFRG